MKLIKSFLLSAVLSVSGTAVAAQTPEAGHIASPKQYSLLFENDKVMVLKMVLAPGESDTLHHHNNETVYFQQGGKLKISVPGEKPLIAQIPDEHIMWHQAWIHQVTNLGKSRVVAIITEQKGSEHE
ncbi:hypothetical protein [Salinimonas lutimaris]|uniref:hypothetical protein n=1 Tax=Salinimonas lutimaris TaxID=914153 RepID=UPI001E3CF141|nr:hypothetical protein [Salinimonas lutimaris]